jgi:hypothetical protein
MCRWLLLTSGSVVLLSPAAQACHCETVTDVCVVVFLYFWVNGCCCDRCMHVLLRYVTAQLLACTSS